MLTQQQKEKINEEIQQVCTTNFPSDSDDFAKCNLKDDLGLDSLDSVEMIMSIENEFNITVSDNETDNLETVEDIYNLVEIRINNG